MNNEKLHQIMYECYGISAKKIEIINRFFLRQSYMIFDSTSWVVFKKYPPYFGEEHLKNIWMFTSALNQYGIRTMEVLEMKDGSFLYQDFGSYYVAYKYIEGNVMKPEDSFEVGKILKKFHNVSKKISYKRYETFEKQICVEQIIDDIQKFGQYRKKSAVAKKIYNNIELFLRCIKEYRMLDNIIIHGDFTLNNILYCGDEKRIIDLDSARYGNIIEDLACFTLSLLYTDGENFELLPRYKEINDFIMGYYLDSDIPKNIVNELCKNLKAHCTIELARQAKHFLIARRYPGNEE